MSATIKSKKLVVLFLLCIFFSSLIWKGKAVWLQAVKKERNEHFLSLAPKYQSTISNFFSDISSERLAQVRTNYLFLGKGKQATAYTEIHGKHVLKVIKWPKKGKKRNALLFSLKLAFSELRQESGVICVVHGPSISNLELPTVIALNKKGKLELIPLAEKLFLLQEKADISIKEALFVLQSQNDLFQGKKIVQALFYLLDNLRKKEIIDRDGALIRNGNIGLKKLPDGSWKALYIDIGKLSRAHKDEITAHEIKRLKPLATWIREIWPELLPYFQELLQSFESI